MVSWTKKLFFVLLLLLNKIGWLVNWFSEHIGHSFRWYIVLCKTLDVDFLWQWQKRLSNKGKIFTWYLLGIPAWSLWILFLQISALPAIYLFLTVATPTMKIACLLQWWVIMSQTANCNNFSLKFLQWTDFLDIYYGRVNVCVHECYLLLIF